MNKDFLEYQYSKSKKLTERAFKLRITMLVVAMLACAGIMASSAFALFTYDIARSTQLKSATYYVSALQTAAAGDTRTYELHGTPGVTGYCVITVWDKYGAPTIYYTKAFCGSMQVTITAAEGSGIQLTPHWGDPRNFGITANLIGNGGVIEHSRTPEPEPEGGSKGESSGVSTADPPGAGTPVPEDTPTVDDTADVSEEKVAVSETPATEKVITDVAEKAETTVTPAVSEEKASAENNNSTVAEAPPPSTPSSDNSSDIGSSSGSSSVTESSPASSAPVSSGESSGGSSSGSNGAESSSASSSSGDSGTSGNGDSGSSSSSSSGGDSGE